MKTSPIDFSRRATDLEIMDDLSCSGEVVHQTLRELDLINRWLGGNKVTLEAVRDLALRQKLSQGTILTIADLGCGSGDILMRIADLGRRLGIPMKLTGVDANPHIVEFAKLNCKQYPEIVIEAINVLAPDFAQRSYDIVIGTLFFHHFDNTTLRSLLDQLVKQVRLGLIINDIHRHWLAFHAIRLLTRFFSSSPMVQFDAPLSVRRAFTREDWVTLLRFSSVVRYIIRWKWAFRWQITVIS